VELDPRPQLESRALGVFGEIAALGECRVIVSDLAEVFDQGVLEGHDEIVQARRAIVLLRVELARGDVGVPGEHHAAFGNDRWRSAKIAHGRHGERGRRDCRSHTVRRVSLVLSIFSSDTEG
jgi:hypothetical protein